MRGCFMSYGLFAFSTLAVVTVLAPPAGAQSVISTRSGVIHFFEGTVYLAGEPLEPHFGKFPTMAQGAELRTAQGRAEVLLTPGVFLRLGENSAIRLVANDLADTRVEMLTGSAIVDSGEPVSGTSVTLGYKHWKMHFLQKGVYRFDSDPPRLRVQQGEAEASADGSGAPVTVKQGMDLTMAAVLVPERFMDAPGDALTDWTRGRSQSISADNAITAQIDEDPASRNSDLGMDGFAYFPLIGVPSLSSGLYGGYNSYYPYQPGFSSIYLPGYTYRPLILGLTTGAYRGSVYSVPFSVPNSIQRRIGVSPLTVSPLTHPIVPAPHAPLPHPAPARPVPHVGVPVGARR
jgi:hypothetical protein